MAARTVSAESSYRYHLIRTYLALVVLHTVRLGHVRDRVDDLVERWSGHDGEGGGGGGGTGGAHSYTWCFCSSPE